MEAPFYRPPVSNLAPDPMPDLNDSELTLKGDPTSAGEDVTLTPEQAWANRPEFQKRYPVLAEHWKYRDSKDPANAGSWHTVGKNVHDWIRKPNVISNMFSAGVMPGMLAGGALLGGGSALLAALRNRFLAGPDDQWNPGVVGGLGLAAGAGLGGWLASKRAGFYRQPPDPTKLVAEMLATVPGLSYADRSLFGRAVPSLSDSEAIDLLRILRTATGATLGAMLMRFFAGKGIVQTATGGLIGSLLGGGFSANTPDSTRSNFWGRPY